MTPRRYAAGGFTLIELLIAMLLGMLLMSALITVFLGGLQTFRTNDALSRMQESGRLVVQMLRRDLRQAGYQGCQQWLTPETDPTAEGVLSDGQIRNTLNSSGWDFSFGNAVEGYRFDSGSWSLIPNPAGDPSAIALDPAGSGLIAQTPRTDSDILSVSHATSPGVMVTAHPGTPAQPGSANIQVDPGNDFERFDILMVTSCDAAAIFQVSSANPDTSGSIAHNTGVGSPGNRTQELGRDFSGAEVYRMSRHIYYVANSAETGRPALFRNDEELAEDVERLRTTFGVDTNADRRIDAYLGPAAVLDWRSVRAVRLELLFSSGDEGGLVERPQELPFSDGTSFTAPDLRRYQIFTATVGVRNRLP